MYRRSPSPIKFPGLGKGEVILRLDTYRTKNVWWKRPFIGKYNERLYAMTAKAVYDVTDIVKNHIEQPNPTIGGE